MRDMEKCHWGVNWNILW